MEENLDALVSIDDAARKLGTTYWSIQGYIKSNNIPFEYIRNKKHVRMRDLIDMPVRVTVKQLLDLASSISKIQPEQHERS